MPYPTPLSEHFTLEALTASSTAQAKGIDNTPSEDLAGNALRLCGLLEEVRAYLSKLYNQDTPLVPTSGFRCHDLNAAVGGQPNSQHVLFQACDFHTLGQPVAVVFQDLRESGLAYDQLILELDTRGDLWIHVSVSAEGQEPRREVLRGTKTAYGSSFQRLP